MEIAKIHGKYRQSINNTLRRLGIETKKMKSEESRGQFANFITIEDYEILKNEIIKNTASESEDSDLNIPGVFYIIQLEPEHDSGRIKLGFASSAEDRLRKHKTAAPFSIILKTWPCKLLWEKTAIESVSQGSEKLYTEVFRTKDINEVIQRCDKFFSLMPELNNE